MLGLTDQTINELLMKPMYHMAEFMLDYVENIISCNEVSAYLRVLFLKYLSISHNLFFQDTRIISFRIMPFVPDLKIVNKSSIAVYFLYN